MKNRVKDFAKLYTTRRIKKVDEFVVLFFPMGPYHKDIMYVTPPYKGLRGDWANIFCSRSPMKRLA